MPSSTKYTIALWEKTIDVQIHFNNLCLRVRSLAISLLGVMVGASAVSYKYGGALQLCNITLPTASILIFIEIVVWIAFYLMDRFWYHELLRGAVQHGLKIEDRIKETEPSISLTNAIKTQSHSSLNMTAGTKLNFFYLGILFVLVVGELFLICAAQ